MQGFDVPDMLRSEYETDIKFSVKELKDLYAQLESLKTYVLMSEDKKEKLPKFQLWVAERGTDFNYKVPAFKYIFNVPLDDRSIDNYITTLT